MRLKGVRGGGEGSKSSPSAIGLPQLPRIPDEVFYENIIPRLPGKSMIRFMWVNKVWKSMIADVLSKISRPRVVFVLSECPDGSKPDEKNSCFHLVDSQGLTEKVSWPKIFKHDTDWIAGSCKGLLLIIVDTSCYLWNPLTTYFTHVLEFDYQSHYRPYPSCRVTNSGICYDSSTDEYKVVIGLDVARLSNPGGFVLVTGLRNKGWKKLDFPYRCYRNTNGVFFNDRLHWRATTDKGYRNLKAPNLIVAFHQRTDLVTELPIPDEFKGERRSILGLGVLDGCLSMACTLDLNSNEVHVLAMKKYGVKKSWRRLLKISNLEIPQGPVFRTLIPLMLMKNEDLLMLRDDNPLSSDPKTVFSYNPKTNKLNRDYPQVICGCPHVLEPSNLNEPCGLEWYEDKDDIGYGYVSSDDDMD